MSDFPTPQQRLGRAVRYFTPVVLASALAVPMISSADSEHSAPNSNGNPASAGTPNSAPNGTANGNSNGNANGNANGNPVAAGEQPQPVQTGAAQAPVAAQTVTPAAETRAAQGKGNGKAYGTDHDGDQGNGKGNGNGSDMSHGNQGNDKPGNGPKDKGDDKPGNGPKDKGDDKPGNGPKDKNDDGKPGNGPKDQNGDGKPGNGPKDPKPGNGPKDPKPGNGPKDPKPGNGPKDPKPGHNGKDGKDGNDGAPAAQPGLTATPVVTTVSSKVPAACKSVRRFRIHLSPRKLRSARVTLNGKRVRVTKTSSGAWAMINLRGKSVGTQIVRTVVVTKGGKVRREVRRYKTCATTKTALRNLIRKATKH
jgi:hypothetical protein